MIDTNGLGSAIGGELLSTSVKRLLLDRIIRGHYKPGERIIELQVSKELGTSQSPVVASTRLWSGPSYMRTSSSEPWVHRARACTV